MCFRMESGDCSIGGIDKNIKDGTLVFHPFYLYSFELGRKRRIEIECVKAWAVSGEPVRGDLKETSVSGQKCECGIGVTVLVDIVVNLLTELIVRFAKIGLGGVE